MVLGDVRDKLYHTRERARQLLSNGTSDVPEEATFNNLEEVITFFFQFRILLFPVIILVLNLCVCCVVFGTARALLQIAMFMW